MRRFEFDSEKSRANKKKHGIDFIEAQELWRVLLIEDQIAAQPESRFRIIGRIGGKHWTAIITYRGEQVRIISVRRSRKEEVKDYE